MIQEKLYRIIRDVFATPDLPLSHETTPADVENWDSFNHINLIISIEEEFGISFDTDEIGKLTNVGMLIKAIARKKGDSA
jgi:acyl carrier protein